MSVYKDAQRKTWYVKSRYKNWRGESQWLTKRGFATRREAVEWERAFLEREAAQPSIRFEIFYDLYRKDLSGRLKESTWLTKQAIIEKWILPYFRDLALREIEPLHVMRWQNELMAVRDNKGKRFSQTYLKTIHNQLSAMFNHAIRFYKLKENPAKIAGAIGEKNGREMKIWTQEEYLRFANVMMDKPKAYYCFEMLYWCGIREGELLALNRSDFDLEKGEVHITKTYHRIGGRDVITDPKTKQSNRTVKMPEFLCEEIGEYLRQEGETGGDARAFPVSKNFLTREMKRGAEVGELPRIRIHDLRHSHVSLLIHMGYSAVDIAKRVGHESIEVTLMYAHMFPNAQEKMAESLGRIKRGA